MALTPQAARSLAAWIAWAHPELFQKLAAQAGHAAPAKGLHDWSDIGDFFSSAADSVGSAVSGVGDWLTSSDGLNSLSSVAGAYFKAQSNQAIAQGQQTVLNAQLARAQAGQPAAPVTYVQNPATGQWQASYVASPGVLPPSAIAAQPPLMMAPGGQVAYPLTRTGLNQLTPTAAGIGGFLSQYGLWIGVGVVGLVLLSSLRGRAS